jgi:hypothetical protein
VRASLGPGDFVVFVCGSQTAESSKKWEYFFTGVATLKEPLTREAIWGEQRNSIYREFLNILARVGPDGNLQQYEFVHKFHDDWKERCSAPYWVFDPDESFFQMDDALHIATYDGQPGAIEKWNTDVPKVGELRSLLLHGAKSTRGLRSTHPQ